MNRLAAPARYDLGDWRVLVDTDVFVFATRPSATFFPSTDSVAVPPLPRPRSWLRALIVAQRLEMPSEAGRAHMAMAHVLPPEDPTRERHVREALELLEPLGAARDQAAARRLQATVPRIAATQEP